MEGKQLYYLIFGSSTRTDEYQTWKIGSWIVKVIESPKEVSYSHPEVWAFYFSPSSKEKKFVIITFKFKFLKNIKI